RNATFIACACLGAALVAAAAALGDAEPPAGGLRVRFDLESRDIYACPYPSDWFTLPDEGQLTGRVVNLPKPDCAAAPSLCAEIDVLNTLDGFNRHPRISIPLEGDGHLDVATAAPADRGVFIVRLGDATRS